MAFKNYREESKKNYGTSKDDGLSFEQITLGAVLRIADATEKMASEYCKLIRDRKLYEEMYDAARKREAKLLKQVASYKGHLKRALKK